MAWDGGDVPTWVQAVSTTGALFAAGWAVRRSGELLKIERTRDEQRDEEAELRRAAAEQAAQADLVAAWIGERQPPAGKVGMSMLEAMSFRGLVLILANQSAIPIYDVRAEVFDGGGRSRGVVTRSLVPSGEEESPLPQVFTEPSDGSDAESAREFRVALEFRDTAGRVWKRDRHGQLERLGRMHFLDAHDTLNITDHVRTEIQPTEDADPD